MLILHSHSEKFLHLLHQFSMLLWHNCWHHRHSRLHFTCSMILSLFFRILLSLQQFWNRLLLGQHGGFIHAARRYAPRISLLVHLWGLSILWNPFWWSSRWHRTAGLGGAPRAGPRALLQGAFWMEGWVTLVTVLIIEIQQGERATPSGTGALAPPLPASGSLRPSTCPLVLLLLGSPPLAPTWRYEGKCRPQSPSTSPISGPSRWSPSPSWCHPWLGSGSRPAQSSRPYCLFLLSPDRFFPAPGNHHSTFCFYEFYYSASLMYLKSYNICPSVSGLYHLAYNIFRVHPCCSMCHSFIVLFLFKTECYSTVYIRHFHLCIHLSMDIRVDSTFQLLWIMLLWTLMCKYLRPCFKLFWVYIQKWNCWVLWLLGFDFLKNYHTVFHNSWTILYFHQ